MRVCRKRPGALMLELLLASVTSLLVGSALFMLVRCTYTYQTVVTGQNTTYVTTRKALNTLVNHLRVAQTYQISAGPPAVYASMAAGSVDAFTCYTDGAGDTERYWLDTSVSPAALKRTQTVSGVATTTTVLTGISSLTFTYYISSDSSYDPASATWVTTANKNAPTSAELPKIGAVQVDVTVSINGFSRKISSFVRLRNSPYHS